MNVEIKEEDIKNKSNYYKNLSYRIKWNKDNKEKLNEYARNSYKNRVCHDENYITKLREDSLKRYYKKKEQLLLNGLSIIKPIGRPTKEKELNEIKKPIGRPRQYVNNVN